LTARWFTVILYLAFFFVSLSHMHARTHTQLFVLGNWFHTLPKPHNLVKWGRFIQIFICNRQIQKSRISRIQTTGVYGNSDIIYQYWYVLHVSFGINWCMKSPTSYWSKQSMVSCI
jgi:hypothetical protein